MDSRRIGKRRIDMWIRSQYKGQLINVENIGINKINNIYIVVTGVIVLGSYTTKEKALGVLDEIEQLLNDNLEMNLDVYQMPKDE